MKSYLFTKNVFHRTNLTRFLPFTLGKGFRGVGPNPD